MKFIHTFISKIDFDNFCFETSRTAILIYTEQITDANKKFGRENMYSTCNIVIVTIFNAIYCFQIITRTSSEQPRETPCYWWATWASWGHELTTAAISTHLLNN
jgi:hypothetical protein